eukprot:CAMPEP_0119417444 /NCGR_PEP_ID=MMETSP1335-20130426/15844_1 /TAXON_ID=259385 /ORGANISM="Chrysoculter rhomboideus, Strain RCC1486" /LENGTH=69 /DNA_ID=CAMNT_0007442625 /DNA_START=1 /DNA_END=207 /DNA_ORIENTATION=+
MVQSMRHLTAKVRNAHRVLRTADARSERGALSRAGGCIAQPRPRPRSPHRTAVRAREQVDSLATTTTKM